MNMLGFARQRELELEWMSVGRSDERLNGQVRLPITFFVDSPTIRGFVLTAEQFLDFVVEPEQVEAANLFVAAFVLFVFYCVTDH